MADTDGGQPCNDADGIPRPQRKFCGKEAHAAAAARARSPHKGMVESYGWVCLVLVVDWYTKEIVGYYAGMPCAAMHGLEALDMPVKCQFPGGTWDQRVFLVSDNGCQPTL